MTKAKANDPGDPIIFIWLLPDVVAFKSEGSKVSKLFLMRACAVMVRVVAQLRHQESAPEGKRLKKRDVGNIATELFSDAAEEIPLTTQAQTHRADVALALRAGTRYVFVGCGGDHPIRAVPQRAEPVALGAVSDGGVTADARDVDEIGRAHV